MEEASGIKEGTVFAIGTMAAADKLGIQGNPMLFWAGFMAYVVGRISADIGPHAAEAILDTVKETNAGIANSAQRH